MKLVNDKFIEAVENELQANQSQGEWLDWKPARDEIVGQLDKHMNKLRDALRGIPVNPATVTEHAADLASLAMKASETFGATPAELPA